MRLFSSEAADRERQRQIGRQTDRDRERERKGNRIVRGKLLERRNKRQKDISLSLYKKRETGRKRS